LILVVVLAVGIRLAYGVTLDRAKLYWADEVVYDEIGWHLAETGHFQSTAYFASPVLPTFLAIVYRVFGHDYRAARICQALLSGVLVLAMFWLADVFFGRKTAYLTALGIALYPPFIYLSGVFYAEHTYMLLMAVTLCSLAQWQQRRRASWLIVAGILMGLTALCRPVFLVFFPFAAAYVWWRAPRKSKLRCSLSVCVVAAATIAPWTLRNAVVFKQFVPISTGLGTQLWLGNNDLSLGDADDRGLWPTTDLWNERAQTLLTDEQRAELTARMASFVVHPTELSEVSEDRRLVTEALRWSRAHPGKFLARCGRRVLTLYSAFTKTITKTEVVSHRKALVAALSFYPVLALGFGGMALVACRNKASLLLHAAIVANLLTYLPLTACTRFRLPIDAYWIAFAAFALVVMWERLTSAFCGAQTNSANHRSLAFPDQVTDAG
jgi:4-amino-4-deoxy-L-arabinose transferase-like glycosyltransferase